MRYLLLPFAIALFCWSSYALSQQPSPNHRPNSQLGASSAQNLKAKKATTQNPRTVAPQIATPQTKTETSAALRNVGDNPTEKWTLSDEIAAGATLAAVLQFIALVVTIGDGRRTARRQLRAYVSGRPDFITSFDATHWPIGSFAIQNFGQTPAYELSHRARIEALPNPLPGGFVFPALPNNWTAPIVLFPNLPMTGHHERGVFFAPHELAGIRNGTMRVYIYGEIRYRDIFRRSCWTTFCSGVTAPQAVITQLANNSRRKFKNIRYVAAPVGNDADHR